MKLYDKDFMIQNKCICIYCTRFIRIYRKDWFSIDYNSHTKAKVQKQRKKIDLNVT